MRRLLFACLVLVALFTSAAGVRAQAPDAGVAWPAAPERLPVDEEPEPVAEPVAEPEPAPAPAPEPEDEETDFWSGFAFGSYGRVNAASDLRGGTGRNADIVSRSPRIDEGTYLELELRREDRVAAMHSKIVASLALNGPLFHFDADFVENIAVRNLFLEVSDVGVPGLSLWGGSRMWRGDDVYLLDTWPLDNVNALGGGAGYAHDLFELRLVGALARPNDPFQTQTVEVIPTRGFTPEEVLLLDRPRFVIGVKGTAFPLGHGDTGVKATLYGEWHHIGEGTRENADGSYQTLPDDAGWVMGGQLGGWLVENRAFVNVFLRYARGLGAYSPLGVPFHEGAVIDTENAEELVVALSANYEIDFVGVQLGGYYRRFRDSDPTALERGLLAEGAIDMRPHVWFLDWLGLSVDLSYQALQTTAIDETTGNVEGGSIWKVGVIPFVSPFGRGTYTRPHLRLIYAATFRDEGARALYPALDPRSSREVEHFLGVGAEWWIDSTSYVGPQAR